MTQPNIWRLNVRSTQVEECIRESLFAVERLPRNPPLQRGDILLLQLVQQEAAERGELDRRIQFALIFDHFEEDITGEISRTHWPDAGKTWRWILYCSDTVPTVPFSLEEFPFGRRYLGQANPQFIQHEHAEVIRPLIKSEQQERQLAEGESGPLLIQIRNQDKIIERRALMAREQTVRRYATDTWLPQALKSLYRFRCQICQHDFVPRYEIPYSEVLHIKPLSAGGIPISRNMLVLCPNHHGIVRVTEPRFDPEYLRFEYPNGLREYLELTDHLTG